MDTIFPIPIDQHNLEYSHIVYPLDLRNWDAIEEKLQTYTGE